MTFGVDVKGVYPIAATPFNADMPVDSVDRHMDFYHEAGAPGMTTLGILGEAQTLEPRNR
jgi:4-hydroxy-tetrahydrodipicolinate synthase